MHEFIRIHRQRLNEAFGLTLRGAPSYTGLRDILQGVDAKALEAAFRAHASSVAAPPESMTAIAVDGGTLRGSFDAFADRQAAHMLSALHHADRIVLGHMMVAHPGQGRPTKLRRKLEQGASRWEIRTLPAFAAKARFRHSPWEALIKTVLPLQRTIHMREPKTGLLSSAVKAGCHIFAVEGV